MANQLGVAINNGEMQKAVDLAERLKTKMIDLKSAKDSWSKMGTGTSLTDTLDKVIGISDNDSSLVFFQPHQNAFLVLD